MDALNSQQRDRILRLLSRRQLFSRLGAGAGALALAALLGDEARAAAAPNSAAGPVYDLLPKAPHFRPKARRVIYLFQNGGPSQVDLFDPKPELARREGEKPGEGFVNDVDAKKTGSWLGSPFRFVRHGQSGLELTELLPELG